MPLLARRRCHVPLQDPNLRLQFSAAKVQEAASEAKEKVEAEPARGSKTGKRQIEKESDLSLSLSLRLFLTFSIENLATMQSQMTDTVLSRLAG